MAGIDTFLDRMRKTVLNTAALVAGIFVVGYIIGDVVNGEYEVQAVDVASSLQKDMSGEGIAAQLRDGIALDWRNAALTSPISAYEKDASEPEITISGTNLSLRYVSKLIRKIVRHPIVELTGQLTPVATHVDTDSDEPGDIGAGVRTVRLILRSSKSTLNPYFDETGPLDQVIDDGALASLAQIDPYAGVIAGSQKATPYKQHALRLAKVLVKNSSEKQKGLAHVAEGTALYQLGKLDEAKADLEQATKEFQASKSDWAAAFSYDGLAIIAISQQRWSDARDAVASALKLLKDGYDSAAYHQIEIDDEMSRRFFAGWDQTVSQKDPVAVCAAERQFRSSQRDYDKFLTDNPTFSVAYTQRASAKLIRLNFMRRKDTARVQCPDDQRLSLLMPTMKEAEDALEEAVAEDPQNPTSWFQSAILKYERQDPQYINSEEDPKLRIALLHSSVEDFRKATKLNGSDYYIWFRFGEALFALQQLDDPSLQSSIIDEARDVFCNSIKFNVKRDDGRYELAKSYLNGMNAHCAAKWQR